MVDPKSAQCMGITPYIYKPHIWASYLARLNIPHEPECVCGNIIPPNPISHFRDHVFHNFNCEANREQTSPYRR